MRLPLRSLGVLAAALAVAACTTTPEGRSRLTPPPTLQGLSVVYSEIDLQLQLITAANHPPCAGMECELDRAFDRRVVDIGERLARAAYRHYPELVERFPRFEFVVADKAEPGTLSSASGMVVIFRGLRLQNASDEVMALILAREMGHVIAGHHGENVAIAVGASVAAQILFPVFGITNLLTGLLAGTPVVSAASGATGAAAGATTSALTSAAISSAASLVGGRAIRASYRPVQLAEAEVIALHVLGHAGWNVRFVSDRLEAAAAVMDEADSWLGDLKGSATRIAALLQGPPPVASDPELTRLFSLRIRQQVADEADWY